MAKISKVWAHHNPSQKPYLHGAIVPPTSSTLCQPVQSKGSPRGTNEDVQLSVAYKCKEIFDLRSQKIIDKTNGDEGGDFCENGCRIMQFEIRRVRDLIS